MYRLIACLFLIIPIDVFGVESLKIDTKLFYFSSSQNRTFGIDPKTKSVVVSSDIYQLAIYPQDNSLEYFLRHEIGNKITEFNFSSFGSSLILKGIKRFEIKNRYKILNRTCPPEKQFSVEIHASQILEAINSEPNEGLAGVKNISPKCKDLDQIITIREQVQRLNTKSKNPLLQCLSDRKKLDEFKRIVGNPQSSMAINRAIQEIETGSVPPVDCEELKDKNILKSGQFREGRIVLFNIEGQPIVNECNNLTQTINHEYLHSLLNGTDSAKEEKHLDQIDKLCWSYFGGDINILDKCNQKQDPQEAKVDSYVVNSVVDGPKTSNPKIAITASNTSSVTNEITAEQIKEVQDNFQISKPDVNNLSVPQSGWNSIAQAKPNEMPPAAKQLIQGANSSFNSITKFADKAIALLASEAKASPSSPSLSSAPPASSTGKVASGGIPASSTSSKKNRDSDFRTVEEYLVGDSKPASGSMATSIQSQSVAQTPRAKTSSSTRSASASQVESGTQEVASNSGSVQQSVGSSNVPQNFKPQAARSSNQRAQSTGSRQPASAEAGTQLLTKQTEVTGQDYRLIRRLYNEQSFKADLINKRIHIRTRAAGLGVDPERAVHVFEDDGSRLRKIGGQ